MRKSLFLYLFIIAVLFNVFTYAYFSKQLEFEKSNAKTEVVKDSVAAPTQEPNYFSLANNQNAQNYFANAEKALDHTKVIADVSDALIAANDNPAGNPYTGQEIMDGHKFIINKMEVLNHRWIIADYSNGDLWGDVLLKYFINDDGSVTFEVVQSVLYQK